MTRYSHPAFAPCAVLALATALVLGGAPLQAQAASLSLPLTQLGMEQTVFLPTIYAQREIAFAKPRSWNVQAGSLTVTFQHSAQLTPNSWLQVILNDKVLKHVPLTKANINNTQLTVALPVAALKDFNRLQLRVEQHYAPKCEDPLDASLWTNILGDKSTLSFTYAPKSFPLKLAEFPFPLVDATTFKPLPINYVLPAQAQGGALAAAANLHAGMAKTLPTLTLPASATLDVGALPKTDGHLVITGTPDQWSSNLQRFVGSLNTGAVKLSGSQWSGGSAADGVAALAPYPGKPGRFVLVVSGDSDTAVERAAQFVLSQRQSPLNNTSSAFVPAGWTTPPPSGEPPSYLTTEGRTLMELGYDTLVVEKIVAPPITMVLPAAKDLVHSGVDTVFDLFYSYSPELNPKFSALEIRLNNHPIANLPLTNEQGEERVAAQIKLPKDLLGVHNELVAQFHLMPDKQGYCIDMYKDKSWGKIHNDSAIKLAGGAGNQLPNLAVLSQARGFPYTELTNLGDTEFKLATLNNGNLEALLAMAGRLGRLSGQGAGSLNAPTMAVSLGDGLGGKPNVIVIDSNVGGGSLANDLQVGLQGNGTDTQVQLKGSTQRATMSLPASKAYGVLEQASVGGGKTVTRLGATDAQAMVALANLIDNDKAFDELPFSPVVRSSALTNTVDALTPEATVSPTGEGSAMASTSSNPFVRFWQQNAWFQWAVYALGGVILLFGLVPFILRLLSGGRR
jgi:hypothetical protein